MSSIETKRVKFKGGKFEGEVMRINANEFDEALHEEAAPPKRASATAEAKKAKPPNGKRK